MARLIVLVLFMVIAINFAVDGVNGQEKSCKNAVADLTKRQMAGISKCTKSLKFKNGKEKSAKSLCILKCVMINEKIMSEDGLYTDAGVQEFISKEFPEADRENVYKNFKLCADEFGSQLDPKEEYCKTYEGFLKCLTSKLAVLCV